jgi:hypothetical protein
MYSFQTYLSNVATSKHLEYESDEWGYYIDIESIGPIPPPIQLREEPIRKITSNPNLPDKNKSISYADNIKFAYDFDTEIDIESGLDRLLLENIIDKQQGEYYPRIVVTSLYYITHLALIIVLLS